MATVAEIAGFAPNPAFLTEFRTSATMQTLLKGIVASAAEVGQSIAPRSDEDDKHYADSIRGRVGVVNYPGVGLTAIGRLYSDNWKAWWIEAGTQALPPRRILARSLAAVSPSYVSAPR